jgi:hypothetical protein
MIAVLTRSRFIVNCAMPRIVTDQRSDRAAEGEVMEKIDGQKHWFSRLERAKISPSIFNFRASASSRAQIPGAANRQCQRRLYSARCQAGRTRGQGIN